MAMIIGFVLPTSKALYEALERYFAQAYSAVANPSIKKNIRYAYNRLIHAYPRGERKYLPFQEEVKYLEKYKSYPVWVSMMNGVKSCYTCHTYTTCGDVKKTIMKKFGLSLEYLGLYHLYECVTIKKTRNERILMDNEKVFDSLAAWQIELPTRPEQKEQIQFQLILKVTFNVPTSEKCINTATLHYIQFNYYFMNTVVPMKQKNLIKICALKARILKKPPGAIGEAVKFVKDKMEDIIPTHVIMDMKDGTLILGIAKLWMKLSEYRLSDCKLAILECVNKMKEIQFNRFICSTDKLVYESLTRGDQITLPEVVTLIIAPQEIFIYNTETSEEIDVINLTVVISWGYDESGVSLVVCKDLKEQDLLFTTKQAPLIDFLLKGYTRILAKKEIKGLSNKKDEKEHIPYAVRGSAGYIEKQKAGYQLTYNLV